MIEYFESINKKIFFKANMLLKRNFYKMYDKKRKQIIRNPVRTISPVDKLIVENIDSDGLNSIKNLKENQSVLRSKPVFKINSINISKKSWIKPCSIPKKLNYSIYYVIQVQRLIRNFLKKLKKIRSLQINTKYYLHPFYTNKENKCSKINSVIRKIINKFRKFMRIIDKIQIIPIVVKKKVQFNTSISTLLKTMFSDFFKKKFTTDLKFILIRNFKQKFEKKVENFIINNEIKNTYICLRNLFNLWKENVNKEVILF